MNEVVSLKQHAELCLNVAIRLALIFWVDAASGYLGKLLCLLCCGAGRLFLSLQAAMHSAVRLWEWQCDRWPKFFPFKRDDMLPWCNSVQKKSLLLVKNLCIYQSWDSACSVSGGGIPVPSRWVLWQLLPGSCSGAANLVVALTLLPHVEANWLDLGWNCSLRSPDLEFCSP